MNKDAASIGNDKFPDYGDEACKLTLSFLTTSQYLKLSIFTFTELFAFVYFQMDYILFARKSSARLEINKLLMNSFISVSLSQFKPHEELEISKLFNKRTEEYGEMTRSYKETSDIVERLLFYLTQASARDDFIHSDDEHIVLIDAFQSKDTGTEFYQFYISTLAPFIKNTCSS